MKKFSKEEFDEALAGLIEKGLVEEVIINGEKKLQLTLFGKSVVNNIVNEDNSKRN
jgi:helix-turn-helix protein